MPGPTKVSVDAPVPAQTPPPPNIGVIVATTFDGTTAGWEVQYSISLKDNTSDVFEVPESDESGLFAANPRIDSHLLATSAIKFNQMEQDGTEYKCVFTQVFYKQPTGAQVSSRIENSGFTITHTVAWQNNRWEYFSEKAGAKVDLSSDAGAGTVRYPTAGWEPVP